MYILLQLYRVWYLSLLITAINGYVLFAANIDDFRSIAKKFVPDKLAEQLAEMAAAPKNEETEMGNEKRPYYEDREEIENRQDGNDERERAVVNKNVEYENEEIVNLSSETKNTQNKNIPKNKQKPVSVDEITSKIDFDKLVEKVKERLDREYKEKYENYKNIQEKQTAKAQFKDDYTGHTYKQSYGKRYTKKSNKIIGVDIMMSSKNQRITKSWNKQKISNVEKYEENRENYNNKNANNNDNNENIQDNDNRDNNNNGAFLFQEIDMTKNIHDSYEDYVTPMKDEKFESKEEYKRKPENKLKRTTPLRTTKRTEETEDIVPLNENVSGENDETSTVDYDYASEPGDSKAVTEDLSYDYRITTEGNIANEKQTLKVNKGTMIPTREYYKMSSPNYYARIPVIAEKYDFNEPIPEKDREPENLKPFGNPPANINGKVKLL